MQRKYGFTLVELLVVITIIGLVAGLLIVGVSSARESARRMQCVNNQRQIGIALINYNNNNKGLPGLASTVLNRELSWVQSILPELGEQKLYDAFLDNPVPPQVTGTLPILICPTSDKTLKDNYTLSYVANAGPGITGDITSTVSAKFAIFKDMRAAAMELKRVKIDEIADGTSNTIIISENLQAERWSPNVPNDNVPNDNWSLDGGLQSTVAIVSCGYQWLGNPTLASPLKINEDRKKVENFPPLSYVRPSSNHPGTVGMLYADGHVDLMNDDIEPVVYFGKMCPDDETATKNSIANDGLLPNSP